MRSYRTELQSLPLRSPQEIITALIAVCLLLLGSLCSLLFLPEEMLSATFRHANRLPGL